MQELWLPVSGYEGFYEVSSYGQVRCLTRQVPHINGSTRTIKGRILKTSVRCEGRHKIHTTLSVSLLRPGFKRKQATIHRLVATAFVPNPDQLPVVRHLDGDSLNNHVDNLAWGTYQDNSDDAIKAGATPRGECHCHARLTEEAARIIKSTPRSQSNAERLGKQFGVHPNTIKSVWDNKSWVWVT